MSFVNTFSDNVNKTLYDVSFLNVNTQYINDQLYPMGIHNLAWGTAMSIAINPATIRGSTRFLLNSFGTIAPDTTPTPISLILPTPSESLKNVVIFISFNDNTFNANFTAGDPPSTVELSVSTNDASTISGQASVPIAKSNGSSVFQAASQFYCDGTQWLFDGTWNSQT
jgi:hypothetical protein